MTEQIDRIALVTGASSGIGEAVCAELLGRGWKVIGASRREGNFKHENYTHIGLNLALLKKLPKTLEQQIEPLVSGPQIKRIALVNNAADPGLIGTVDSIDPMAMQEIYAVNVTAPTCLMGWLARLNKPGISRRIVNVSTGAAIDPYPGLCAYGSTKAALRMAGMVLAAELDAANADPDFTILSYEPGVVDTQMQQTVRSASALTLPVVDVFTGFHENGLLVHPSGPALEIVTYLEADGHNRFKEQRFGGLKD